MSQLDQNIATRRTETLRAVALFPKTVNIVGLLICVVCAVYFGSLKWKKLTFFQIKN
jgi:hypothetical protein